MQQLFGLLGCCVWRVGLHDSDNWRTTESWAFYLYILVVSLLAATVTGILPGAPLSQQTLASCHVFLFPFWLHIPCFSLYRLLPPLGFPKKLYFPCIIMQSNFVFHPLLVSGASKTFLFPNALTTQASTPDLTPYLQRKMVRGFATSVFSLLFSHQCLKGRKREVEMCCPTADMNYAILLLDTRLRRQPRLHSGLVLNYYFPLIFSNFFKISISIHVI